MDSLSSSSKFCSRCKVTRPLDQFAPDRKVCLPCSVSVKARTERVKMQPSLLDVPAEKTCNVCGETKPIEAFKKDRTVLSGYKSLCNACNYAYVQQKRRAKAQLRTEKTCSKCHEIKPLQAFKKDQTALDGHKSICKQCHTAMQVALRGARPDNQALRRIENLQQKYGITEEQYQELWEMQNGVCRVCKMPEKAVDGRSKQVRRLAVDHDHVTGKVRGLLCGACNRALGLLADDPLRIEALREYVLAFTLQ